MLVRIQSRAPRSASLARQGAPMGLPREDLDLTVAAACELTDPERMVAEGDDLGAGGRAVEHLERLLEQLGRPIAQGEHGLFVPRREPLHRDERARREALRLERAPQLVGLGVVALLES